MNNEPAFPLGSGDMRDPVGMTLRDYFAAKAMQALKANPQHVGLGSDSVAKRAYEIADAMFMVRERGE